QASFSSGEGLTLPRVTCPNHPDAILVEDYRAGDMICPECGLVVGTGSWYRIDSNVKGTHPSTFLLQGTGAASFDEFGNSKYQNRRTMSSSDRAMLHAFKEISNMADRINLPRNIVDRTNNLFKQVYEQKSLKGRANDAIASACLYIACRQEGVPRTFKEIGDIAGVADVTIRQSYRLIYPRAAELFPPDFKFDTPVDKLPQL
uniref:Transcription initiation factor IIB n=1 Tax=Nothobranchius furzeri TaxID=105023 RepID=A0A8C6MGS1_NOTFU